MKDYEIVAEHIPSQVILIAHQKFKHQGTWHTWIDFQIGVIPCGLAAVNLKRLKLPVAESEKICDEYPMLLA